MDISLAEVASAVNGKLIGDADSFKTRITGVSRDSRERLNHKLFVAIAGERLDGHDFITQAFENGAVCVISHKDDCHSLGKPVIKVASTKDALCSLAEYYKSLHKLPVIGITGSSGKTTTKDMVYSVLSTKFKTLCTEGNYNNEIGLPLTVFNLNESHECAVLEMGMNHFGELRRLSKIAKPNVCVITNIGYTHIENLGSREGILKAKAEIFEFMRDDGFAVLNGDDNMLSRLFLPVRTIRFGLGKSNDVYADNIRGLGVNGTEGTEADIYYKRSHIFSVKINVPGEHSVYNALCAAAVGLGIGLDGDSVRLGLEGFAGSKMRMCVLNDNLGRTIINDTYNSNPAAMRMAIDVLARYNSPRACIVGDMLELGDFSRRMHREIGQYLLDKQIEKIICVGNHARHIYDVIAESNRAGVKAYYFANQEDMLESVITLLDDAVAVLVKASRTMAFEKTVDYIHNNKR